ncbi:zinc ribbon domain-containing protein [Nitrosococcus halophilus]|uniref:zinc ribbon domain-containing protein n=1 Tax=Nitrosococcus halophilus TaxID=133539 RepID=UPI00193D8E81
MEYKAKLAGIWVQYIGPWYTSHTCSACGHADKANRKTQSHFQCVSCGHIANADTNAAINIAARAEVMQPIVMRAMTATDGPSTATSLVL